jgi:uroporphyrinogen III methyltransferase/synthase
VITIIGESVNLRHEIAWFETRPLFGKRLVVTRATAVGGGLAEQLRGLGADVLDSPATGIEAASPGLIDAAIARLAEYQWLLFTSPTGVRFFFEALDRAGLDSRSLANLEIAVIGPATAAALESRGLKADVRPPKFVAESLLETLTQLDVSGSRILYATAEDARDVLGPGLRNAGATVDVVAMYRSVPLLNDANVDDIREAVGADRVDLVCFTSASGVNGFVAQVGEARARGLKCASIGPVTSDAARAAGMTVVVEPSQASIADLVSAIVEWSQRSQERA